MYRVGWSVATDGKEWDEFVFQNGGSVFHTWPWRRVLEDFGSEPLYLEYRNPGGEILAVCPFVYATGHRFLHLDSLPHTFMAGPIIRGSEEAQEILGTLSSYARFTLRKPVIAMHVTTHLPGVIAPMQALGFENREDPYGLLITDLRDKTPEHIWNHGFDKHDRQAVKYHENLGSTFRVAAGRRNYQEYLTLQQGPQWNPFGQHEFFSDMEANILGGLRVALVSSEARATAALLVLLDPGISTAHLLTMRYSLLRNIHSPVTYINWKIANWAYENGFRYLDFGIWLAKHAIDPSYHAFRIKRRFEASFLPRLKFTIRPSGVAYTLARRINRVVQRMHAPPTVSQGPGLTSV